MAFYRCVPITRRFTAEKILPYYSKLIKNGFFYDLNGKISHDFNNDQMHYWIDETYYSVKSNAKYKVNNFHGYVRICFYDSYKKFMKRILLNSNTNPLPYYFQTGDEKYIRISSDGYDLGYPLETSIIEESR